MSTHPLIKFFTVSAFRVGRGSNDTPSNQNRGESHEYSLQIVPTGNSPGQGGDKPRPASGRNSDTKSKGRLTARTGVFLSPWEDGYEDELLRWRNDIGLLHLWNGDRKLVTRRKLRKELDELLEKALAFLIFKHAQARPLGFVYAAPATSPVQKHYNIGCFVDDRSHGKGVGPAATALFVRYLFENFDTPKLAFEVYGWNAPSLKAVSHYPQFRLEGVRKRHVHYNGGLHDLHEFGLSREDFTVLTQTPFWRRMVG